MNSLAEELLATLPEENYAKIATQTEERHIVIGENRRIIVPDELKNIAVTGDKDVETVTFDCVRYWDGHDLSTFSIFLYYSLPDGVKGVFTPNAIYLSDDYYSFDWTIGSELTHREGTLAISLVARQKDADGNVLKQWGSFPNGEMKIVAGLFNPGMPDGGGGGSSGGGTIIALENVPVELNLSSGDQKVSSESGYLMKSVLIKKPNTLIPENIRYGVNIAGIIGAYKGASGGGDVNPPIHHEASNTATVEVGKVVNLSPAFDSSWDTTGAIHATVTEVDNDGVVSIGDFRFGLYFECTGLKPGTAIVKINGGVTQEDGTVRTCEITYTITVTGSTGGDEETHNFTDSITLVPDDGETMVYIEYKVPTPDGTYERVVVDLDSVTKEKIHGIVYGITGDDDVVKFRAAPRASGGLMEFTYKAWNYETGKYEACFLALTIFVIRTDVLGTPTISLDGDTLTITAGTNTPPKGYEIYVDGEYKGKITNTTLELSTTYDISTIINEAGTYSIYVRAYTAELDTVVSSVSDTVSYTKSASGGDEPTDVLNFDQQINITEGSAYEDMVYVDSGDWDTPIIDRIEVISNDGSVEVEDTTGSEFVRLSGNWSGDAVIIKYHCHTHDNYVEEDVYYTVTYTIYVDSNDSGVISFEIERDGETTTYYAEKGMTWGQWVGSEYNTDGFYRTDEADIEESSYPDTVWYETWYIDDGINSVIEDGGFYSMLFW